MGKSGGSATGVRGRSTIDVSTSKSILIDVFPSKSNNDQIAQGWTLSNVHNLGIDAVFKGDGSKLKKETALTNGLVAYYKFDGNTQDSSLNGNHASGHGISYVDGLTGKAAQFDGNYDYVSLNESTKTPYLGVSAWFNTTSTKSGKDNIMMLIRLRNYGYVINLNAGGPNGKVAGWVSINNTSSSYSFTSPGSYNDGEWHHVVMNYSSEGFELYMDGVLLSKQSHHTNGAIYGGGGGYSIGRDGSHSSDYYEGLVDEFRIYNRALTENEIRELYLKGQTGQTVYSFDTLDISDVTQEYGFDLAGKHLVTNSYPDKKVLESYTYDENGKLITITDQFGEVTAITRDSDGNPTEITAPNGQKTYLTVDEQGNLTEIRYEDNSRYEFTYLDGSLMDIMTDPNGNRIDHIFDENGRITEEVDGEGGSYQFLRNVTEDETFYSTVQPMGETQTSQDSKLTNGDTRSLITLPTEDTITATFSKDEKTVTSQKDGVSTVTTYTADTLTHQKTLASRETTQPGGLKQTVTYNTSYDGNETHTNSKTQTITNNGKITKILTDYNSGVETLTSPTGRSATREYDIDTRLTSSLTSGTLTPTTFTYDSKGRVTTEATGTRETTYTYDDRGNVESITDPRNKITTFTYDVMDRVTGVSYPDGTTEAFSYDNNGNLLTRTVPTPADHAFTYNGVDRKTGYTSPLQKATIYTYNKSKQVTQIERPSGKTITNTYDKGRLVSTSTPEGTTEYSYLFADKVGSITHGSESFSFTYDGTLLTTIAQNGLLNHTINYTYNNDFKVTSSTYAGVTENYSYDNDGLLTDSGDYTLTRDAQNGYVTQLTDGTLTQSRSYNSYGELTELSDNTLTCQLPQRDDSGAITQKKEIINGVTATYDYTYDDMGRLIEVKKDGSVTEAYTYDNNGNRLSATVNGETTTASYTLDDQLEVYGDNTYRYDDDGYLVEKITPEGTTTYDYGTFGELRKIVTPTQTITYKHNANNQRVAKLIDGQVVEKYLWADLTTLLAIYDANDNLLQRFEYADQRMPVSMSANSTKYYLHYDQVGSLRAVSDASGNIVKEVVYDTFGTILTDTNPNFKVPFGFAGGLYDRDTGLTRFGYRDYDATTGKWTAKDPIGFKGEDSNLYAYVWEDPINWTDPLGLYSDPRLNGRGVPRAMGGDGGISDAVAARNGIIATPFLMAAGLTAGISTIGPVATLDIMILFMDSCTGLSDGVDRNDRLHHRYNRPDTQFERRQREQPRRNNRRFPLIRR